MTFLKNIFISLFGLAFTLLLLEGIYRLFLQKSLVTKPWSDRPEYYFQHESSATLQDYPHQAVKPANTFRIAVVGDSFTFAPYMQFTDAFPKVMERMLNLNLDAPRAEVINYGVPAYSTNHEIPVVQQAIAEGADVIILQITLNDPEIKGETPIGITQFGRFGAPQYPEWLKTVFRFSKSAAFVAERIHNSQTKRDYIDYFSDLFNNKRSWGQFQKSLQTIAKRAEEGKIPLRAVVFPLFGIAQDSSYPFWWIHEKVANELRTLKVPSIDLSGAYKDIPLERLQVLPGIDRHPNEIGHRIAAEKMYDYLVRQGVIPLELQIKKRFKKRTQIIKEQPFLASSVNAAPLKE